MCHKASPPAANPKISYIVDPGPEMRADCRRSKPGWALGLNYSKMETVAVQTAFADLHVCQGAQKPLGDSQRLLSYPL